MKLLENVTTEMLNIMQACLAKEQKRSDII